MNPGRYVFPLPAIPADNATTCLFTTRNRTVGGVVFQAPQLLLEAHAKRIETITVVFLTHNKVSAANGLRVWGWDAIEASDQGGAWRETDLKDDFGLPWCGAANPVTVPALAAGQEFRRTFVVPHLTHKAIDYTAGPDNPENFTGYIVVDMGALAVGR